jgi:hypothetical protein
VTSHARIDALLDGAGEITHIQVAVDGRWEDARRVWRGERTVAISTLVSILRPRGELAVEVFAARANGCQTFVGMRFRDIDKEDATDLLRALLEVVTSTSVRLADVTAWLARKTGTAFFVGKPTRVEIGVVDAWLSLGARDISTVIDANGPELRGTLLDAAEGLRAPANRVIAVEFAFDAPPARWLGVEVAQSTSGGVVASEPIAGVIDALGAHA